MKRNYLIDNESITLQRVFIVPKKDKYSKIIISKENKISPKKFEVSLEIQLSLE